MTRSQLSAVVSALSAAAARMGMVQDGAPPRVTLVVFADGSGWFHSVGPGLPDVGYLSSGGVSFRFDGADQLAETLRGVGVEVAGDD